MGSNQVRGAASRRSRGGVPAWVLKSAKSGQTLCGRGFCAPGQRSAVSGQRSAGPRVGPGQRSAVSGRGGGECPTKVVASAGSGPTLVGFGRRGRALRSSGPFGGVGPYARRVRARRLGCSRRLGRSGVLRAQSLRSLRALRRPPSSPPRLPPLACSPPRSLPSLRLPPPPRSLPSLRLPLPPRSLPSLRLPRPPRSLPSLRAPRPPWSRIGGGIFGPLRTRRTPEASC